jgi:natural product biosynthesis luciferase-like monooxygenase protein
MNTVNQNLAHLFSAGAPHRPPAADLLANSAQSRAGKVTFSCIFFSDVRKDVSNIDKYRFVRELVEFADQAKFEAVCFPERHFYEFGSIYANSSVIAAYFAPLTRHVRLRAAAVTNTLHHPAEIVENWAMVDILSNGRVDLGFGSGWNKADYILSPDTYENRSELRNERIEIIRKLWRGESVDFAGPGGQIFATKIYPTPVQKELNVWYSTFSEQGFEHAGRHGYNIFTMLFAIEMPALERKIAIYRQARHAAGFDPATGIVSLLIHAFVHPDEEWMRRVVAAPLKEYIRSSTVPQMKAVNKSFNPLEIDKIIDYSYARYLSSGGIFGSLENCQKQIDRLVAIGVNDIAFLQDYGVDYAAVVDSLQYLRQLVDQNTQTERASGC